MAFFKPKYEPIRNLRGAVYQFCKCGGNFADVKKAMKHCDIKAIRFYHGGIGILLAAAIGEYAIANDEMQKHAIRGIIADILKNIIRNDELAALNIAANKNPIRDVKKLAAGDFDYD